MKLQNKSFHKSWINNVQKREKNISSNLSNNKYILKIIFLSLIILSVIIVLKWWQKVPNKEILHLGTSMQGRLMLYDGLAQHFSEIAISKNPNCKICGLR